MPVAVIHPPALSSTQTMDRVRRLCREYFAGQSVEYFESRSDQLPAAFVERSSTFDVIVVSEELSDHHQALPPSARLYSLQHNRFHVMLRLQNGSVDASDYGHIGAHAFNRLGPHRQWDTMEFFPYGYIYRETGMGPPVDPFGFRITADLEQLRRSRTADQLLVAVLGGSSVWSWFCFPEETFCAQLEARLNQPDPRRQTDRRVTVLNFGQGGATVLHEMQTFLLHVDVLRPDIVITQDGFNDVLWGMTTDPALLRRGICAPHVFEGWSARLHGHAEELLRYQHGQPVSVVNGPDAIVDAYLLRKEQLDRVVRSHGGVHLAALQPYAGSKRALSADERATVEHERYIWIWREPYNRVRLVYQRLSEAFSARFDGGVNFHRRFAGYGDEETLFQDIVHTTPEGESRIAAIYADVIFGRGLV